MKVSLSIDSYEAIDSLEQLNGTMIPEIEKRARPGAYAITGFLGKKESLKDVLKTDWKVVQNLGTTHIELADQIDDIWKKEGLVLYGNALKQCPVRLTDSVALKLAIISAIVSIAAAVVFANPFALFGLALPVALTVLAISKLQILYVKYESTRGIQENIFEPEKNKMHQKGWNSQIKIINLLNCQRVTIGNGVVDYIRNYGFYEGGGEKNAYRVDPARLVAILTGAALASVRSHQKNLGH